MQTNLIFSLTANECLLYSQSNSANYYQTSEIIQRNKLVSDSRLYYFCKSFYHKNILLFSLQSFIKLESYISQRIRINLKLQTIRCFKIAYFFSKYLHLYKSENSKKTYSSLYIG